MWLPRRDDVDAGRQEAVRGRRRQAHAAGHVLAVGGHEVDAALLAQLAEDRFDGDPAGLADHVADHQDAAGARRPRAVAVGRIAQASPADRPGHALVAGSYFAYSTARVSRMTVTLIWPG